MAAPVSAVASLLRRNIYSNKNLLQYGIRAASTGGGSTDVSAKAQEALKEHNTNFGFKKVDPSVKQEKVREVFDSVASNYDLMNDISSLGIHRCWKDQLIERIRPVPGMQHIDMAGGTGDVAIRFLKQAKINGLRLGIKSDTPTRSTICDINKQMLEAGKKRPGLPPNLDWKECNAEKLEFQANSFDVYTIAFGIRNVTHIDKVLSEAYRVLKPGGRFLCLEFSKVQNPFFSMIYDAYSFQVIPVMGQIFAGDFKSYQYLVESIRKFPNQELFTKMIEEAGFRCVTHDNLFDGIAAIHVGFKL